MLYVPFYWRYLVPHAGPLNGFITVALLLSGLYLILALPGFIRTMISQKSREKEHDRSVAEDPKGHR